MKGRVAATSGLCIHRTFRRKPMTICTQTASSVQVAGDGQTVCKAQTNNPHLHGGASRLARSGVVLTDAQMSRITEANAWSPGPAIVTFPVWPLRVEDGALIVGGRCPLCNIFHTHGHTTNPLRSPSCSSGLPPFNDGRPIPFSYRLVVTIDVLPEAIAFANRAETSDLLFYAALALRLGMRWRRRHTALAFSAILRSGVLSERISILRFDAGLGESAAKRAALYEYVRGSGRGKIRSRIANALLQSWRDAGRGVL